jgi:glucokinase
MTVPRQCGCGRFGCLEAYASATSVVQRARDELALYSGRSALRALAEKPDALTCRAIFDTAAEGDALADRIVEETAYYLAVGATNMLHMVDPDMVVFGGGMIAAGDGFLERIRSHVRRLAFPVPAAKAQIRYAQLGSDAGFIGAAACARQLCQRK